MTVERNLRVSYHAYFICRTRTDRTMLGNDKLFCLFSSIVKEFLRFSSYVIMIHQRHRQTDRRTDGRTIDSNWFMKLILTFVFGSALMRWQTEYKAHVLTSVVSQVVYVRGTTSDSFTAVEERGSVRERETMEARLGESEKEQSAQSRLFTAVQLRWRIKSVILSIPHRSRTGQ